MRHIDFKIRLVTGKICYPNFIGTFIIYGFSAIEVRCFRPIGSLYWLENNTAHFVPLQFANKNEVTGEWRRLRNEELNDLHCSPSIARVIKWRRMRWAGHVERTVEERGVYRVLVGKPEGRRPPGRPRRRWVDNIRMYLQEVGCVYMDWIGLAQDRDRWRTLVSAVMNLRVP